MIYYFIFTIIGFLSGSILYAYWLPLIICRRDVYEAGRDGNPGTANAYQTCGFFIGTAVLIMELLKGCLPVYLAAKHTDISSLFFVPVMTAPVFGHAAPFFDTKKGGKAIAVSFGVLLGLFPEMKPLLFLAATYIVFSLIIVIRPHLFRSVFTFLVFFVLTYLFTNITSIKAACAIISFIVIAKHMKNYQEQPEHMEQQKHRFSVSLFGIDRV